MKDRDFLEWLHERLIVVHGENRNFDYMHRLREIIAKFDVSLYDLMTPADVAKRYGISEKRLKNWRENKSGGPRWLKIANDCVRYRREDVMTWELTRLVK